MRENTGLRITAVLACLFLVLVSVTGVIPYAQADNDYRVTGRYFVSVFDQGQLPDSLDDIDTSTSLYSKSIDVPRAINTAHIPLGSLPLYNPDGIDETVLVATPSVEQICAACDQAQIAFDPKRDKVIWYVVKPLSDGWHVDGAILKGQLDPVVPVEPEEPEEPDDPVVPEDPEGPEDPVAPEEPEGPDDPAQPQEPADPAESQDPTKSEEPAHPAKPSASSSAGAHKTPNTTDEPDQANTPTQVAPAAEDEDSSGEQPSTEDADPALPATDEQSVPLPNEQPKSLKQNQDSFITALQAGGEVGAGALSIALAGLLTFSVGRTLSLFRAFRRLGGGKK